MPKKLPKPLVTFVVPVYNYGDKVCRALDSIKAQTINNFEVFVVNDGSKDDTEEIIKEYIKSDPRFHYIYQENSGVAVARNRGIDSGSAPYCACLDADDALAPQFVEACLPELEKDQSLGIAFTKILAIIPDGRQQVSQWPDGWNYDEQLKRHNQVPTACMFRKEMWRRLGGYRQRYAPNGAGSEDAEFWLRSGAYGWKAKMVTDAPLFIYSLGTGNVSGNKQYREVDWTSLHPWCRDGNHPFTSYATPVGKKYSHPIRQYDEPIVSVIIPVKSGHKSLVFNALDSLEAQTFRKWEAIVIDDTGDENEKWSFDGVDNMLEAYPYVRMLKTPGRKGAGYARNRGVEAARGSMILFLDADDNFLSGDAIQMMMDTWNATGQIVYTDYVGKSYLDAGAVDLARRSGRLVDYNEKTGLAMTRSNASEYDCERALAQPQEPFYIWNLITSLLPKAWHNEIGGFDENMESWEDWVYWLMLARVGKCFIRIPEPLVVYRFYTGERREYGIKNARELVQYIIKKFSGVKTMPCGCSKKNPGSAVVRNSAVVDSKATTQAIKDDDVILIVYTNPNTGMHRVVGAATGTDYGYRSGGGVERFYVMREDQRSRADWFEIVTQVQKAQEEAVTPPPPPQPRKRNVVK